MLSGICWEWSRRCGQEEMAGKGGVAKGRTPKRLQLLPSSKSKPQRARIWEVLSLSWYLSAGPSSQVLLHLLCWEKKGSQAKAKSGQRGALIHQTNLLLPQLMLWCSLDKALCLSEKTGTALELLSLEIKYNTENSAQSVLYWTEPSKTRGHVCYTL